VGYATTTISWWLACSCSVRRWLPEDTWQRIACKTYELYEQRGPRDGYDLQDWLDAEYLPKFLLAAQAIGISKRVLRNWRYMYGYGQERAVKKGRAPTFPCSKLQTAKGCEEDGIARRGACQSPTISGWWEKHRRSHSRNCEASSSKARYALTA
jgi:hypothetical protein